MNIERLKYLVIGAGGTGGAIGSHMARAGHDVTFIARGRHLAAMREGGLKVSRPDGEFVIDPVSAFTTEEYTDHLRCAVNGGSDAYPDVIFVCVKGYSIDDTIPFLKEASGPDTTVTDGCIYVASEIKEPGHIWMNGTILRVVFGLRKDQKHLEAEAGPLLERVRDDLCSAGIEGILSDNIERDSMRKFSYVSPQGACGLYYDVPAGAIQQQGEIRECFEGLIREISDLADAMGIGFGEDIVPVNLKISAGLSPDMTTSLQRDIAAGRASEIDGLIYDVVRMGERYGVSMPLYEKISTELKLRLQQQK